MTRTELQSIVHRAFLATVPRRHSGEVPDETHAVFPNALVHQCNHDEVCCAHTVYAVSRFIGPNKIGGPGQYEELCAVVMSDDADDDVDLEKVSTECQDFADMLAKLFAALPEIDRLLAEDERQLAEDEP